MHDIIGPGMMVTISTHARSLVKVCNWRISICVWVVLLVLQVWVGVVPVGPKGAALNSSYNNRDSREYKEDLGYAVVNFARMVPDGLLVFFPSYGVLKSCTDYWKNTSVAGTGAALTVPNLQYHSKFDCSPMLHAIACQATAYLQPCVW